MTTQPAEILIVDGKKYKILAPSNCQSALSKKIIMSEVKMTLISVDSHPGIEKIIGEEEIRCSGTWKRYTGKWELKENALYLLGFERGPYKLKADEPLRAHWFSGKIAIRNDDIECIFTIENGNLMKTEHFNNKEFMEEQEKILEAESQEIESARLARSLAKAKKFLNRKKSG